MPGSFINLNQLRSVLGLSVVPATDGTQSISIGNAANSKTLANLAGVDANNGLAQVSVGGTLASLLAILNSTGGDPSGGKQLKLVYGQYAFPSTGSGATSTGTVTLSNAAVFTSATSYLVFITSASYGFGAAAFLAASAVSASQFDVSFWNGFTSAQSMTANWLAIGY